MVDVERVDHHSLVITLQRVSLFRHLNRQIEKNHNQPKLLLVLLSSGM